MPKSMRLFFLSLGVAALLLIVGCSNSPSDDELRKLQELQAQVKQLDEQVATQQRDNAALEKQTAEKNGKLQQCQADQEAVRKATGVK
jgi:outer membrane murein-binding lipoprotein Lpp